MRRILKKNNFARKSCNMPLTKTISCDKAFLSPSEGLAGTKVTSIQQELPACPHAIANRLLSDLSLELKFRIHQCTQSFGTNRFTPLSSVSFSSNSLSYTLY